MAIITPTYKSPGVTAPLPSDGNDNISAGGGADFIDGGRGVDILNGDGGNDTVVGGEGDDDLQGNAGIDLLSGGKGNDHLRGGIGNDTLLGEDGNDWLEGENGNDVLVGGLGQDTLNGGGNSDQFVFNSVEESGAAFSQRDTISDFAMGDQIDLRLIDANVSLPGNQVFTPGYVAVFGGVAGQLMWNHFAGDNILSGDVDGDASADFAIVLNGIVPPPAFGVELLG